MPLRNKCSKNIEQRALEMTQQRCAIEQLVKTQPASRKQIYSAMAVAGGLGFVTERLLNPRRDRLISDTEKKDIARRRHSMALTAARFAYTLA